jgi:uncharacterized protein YhhL (DUF1145 family)
VIVEKLIELCVWLLGLVVTVIPFPGPPDWLTSTGGAFASVFSGAVALGVWFPTGLVLAVILGVFALRLSGLGVRIGRMVLSLFTGGGGNAGG